MVSPSIISTTWASVISGVGVASGVKVAVEVAVGVGGLGVSVGASVGESVGAAVAVAVAGASVGVRVGVGSEAKAPLIEVRPVMPQHPARMTPMMLIAMRVVLLLFQALSKVSIVLPLLVNIIAVNWYAYTALYIENRRLKKAPRSGAC
jgi:hypothetical protein